MGTASIRALISRYTAQKEEALATLSLYLNNPSAVPDHSGIIDEIDKLIQNLSTAEALLATLDENIRVEDRSASSIEPDHGE